MGLYHNAAMYLGHGALVVLEEAERIHPAISDQHVFLVLSLFGSCLGAFCHQNFFRILTIIGLR
jgi:hypothetical protein